MLTWILIIVALAFIFGVIKIDQVKNMISKYEPEIKNVFNKMKTLIDQKASEIKKNNKVKTETETKTEAKTETKTETETTFSDSNESTTNETINEKND